jgi:hypothetical protein
VPVFGTHAEGDLRAPPLHTKRRPRWTIVCRWAEVMAGQLNSTGEGSVASAGANDNAPLSVEDAVRLP